MISIWEVQTVWETRRKCFKRCPDAEGYFGQLYRETDNCAELHRIEVTEEEFNEIDFAD